MHTKFWNISRTNYTLKDNEREIFISYDTKIAIKNISDWTIILDKKYWNYSNTTGYYRNQFLWENKKQTEKKIKEGIYILKDLN